MVGDNYDRGLRRTHFNFDETTRLRLLPSSWPTREELAYLNFGSVVATGRAILNTAPCVRSLGDASREPMQHGDTGFIPRGHEDSDGRK
jgi:hypothetical protein